MFIFLVKNFLKWDAEFHNIYLKYQAGYDNVRNPASGACRQGPNFVGRKGREKEKKLENKRKRKRKRKGGKRKKESEKKAENYN